MEKHTPSDYEKYTSPENPKDYHTPELLLKRKYIVDHVEPPTSENEESTKLDDPVLELPENGSTEIVNDGFQINATYSPYIVEVSPGLGHPPIFKEDSERRYLVSLSVANTDTGQSFQLQDILPEGYRVVFSIATKDRPKCEWEDKRIIIMHNPSTLRGLITLLHEIGHSQSPLDSKIAYYHQEILHSQYQRDTTDEAIHNILKIERDAWAFALKTLKIIIDKNRESSFINLEKIKRHIHQFALESYSKEMRKHIETSIQYNA